MNPFVWVLVDYLGYPRDVLPDSDGETLESAWTFFSGTSNDRKASLQHDGYRVLRCKLTEVGPA